MNLAHTKVCDPKVPLVVDQYVLRLEVPIDDSFLVHVVEG